MFSVLFFFKLLLEPKYDCSWLECLLRKKLVTISMDKIPKYLFLGNMNTVKYKVYLFASIPTGQRGMNKTDLKMNLIHKMYV